MTTISPLKRKINSCSNTYMYLANCQLFNSLLHGMQPIDNYTTGSVREVGDLPLASYYIKMRFSILNKRVTYKKPKRNL